MLSSGSPKGRRSGKSSGASRHPSTSVHICSCPGLIDRARLNVPAATPRDGTAKTSVWGRSRDQGASRAVDACGGIELALAVGARCLVECAGKFRCAGGRYRTEKEGCTPQRVLAKAGARTAMIPPAVSEARGRDHRAAFSSRCIRAELIEIRAGHAVPRVVEHQQIVFEPDDGEDLDAQRLGDRASEISDHGDRLVIAVASSDACRCVIELASALLISEGKDPGVRLQCLASHLTERGRSQRKFAEHRGRSVIHRRDVEPIHSSNREPQLLRARRTPCCTRPPRLSPCWQALHQGARAGMPGG